MQSTSSDRPDQSYTTQTAGTLLILVSLTLLLGLAGVSCGSSSDATIRAVGNTSRAIPKEPTTTTTVPSQLDCDDNHWDLASDSYFEFDKATVADSARRNLMLCAPRLIQRLALHEISSIAIKGEADSVGTAAHNLDLSERRAEAVAGVLEAGHVPRAVMIVYGIGERDAPQGIADETHRRVTVTLR